MKKKMSAKMLLLAILMSTLFFACGSSITSQAPDGDRNKVNNGQKWERSGLGTWEIQKIMVDPNDPAIVYTIAHLGTSDDLVKSRMAIYKSIDSGDNWKEIFHTTSGYDNAIVDMAIDPVNNRVFVAGELNKVWVSKDYGKTWTRYITNVSNINLLGVDPNDKTGQTLFAGGTSDGIYRSVDGGVTWEKKRERGVHLGIEFNNNNIYVIMLQGILKSEDGGDSWQYKNTNLPIDEYYHWISISGRASIGKDYLLLAVNSDKLYYTYNGGEYWTEDPKLESYFNKQFPNIIIGNMLVYFERIYLATSKGVFHMSENHDITPYNEGLTTSYVDVLAVNDSYLFAGTWDGIWRRPH